MESLTTNPTPSPLDQAYQRYQNDLKTRITGAESEQELMKGIIEGKISREKVRELKSEMVSVDEFKTFYPKESLVGREIKETYNSSSIVYEHPVEVSGIQSLSHGTIVFSDKGDNLFRLKQQSDGKYMKELIHHCDSFILGFQVLSDGRIFYLGGNNVTDEKALYQLIEEDELPFVTPNNNDDYWDKLLIPSFDGGTTTFQYVGGGKMYIGTGNGNVHVLSFHSDGSYDDKLVIEQTDPRSNIDPLEVLTDMSVLPDNKIIFKCGWGTKVILADIKNDTLVSSEVYGLNRKLGTIFDNGVLLSSGILSAMSFGSLKIRSVWDHKDDAFQAVDVMPDKNIVFADVNTIKILK
jgi:hypothetical protein